MRRHVLDAIRVLVLAAATACVPPSPDRGADARAEVATDAEARAIDADATDRPPGDAPDAAVCAAPTRPCGAACVDLASDPAHCGACDAACPPGAACVAGVCACPNGGAVCGARCAELARDPANCGACDHACGANAVCSGGRCTTCAASATPCGTECVVLATDPANCGACGRACDGTIPCVGGACVCPAGQVACAGRCADLARDDRACGACDHACAAGTLCVGGTCQPCTAAPAVGFAGTIQPIFTARCLGAGCHEGPVPAQALDLEAGMAREQLVGVAAECGTPRVDPRSSATSTLVGVLVGAPCGDVPRMPLSGGPLPAAELDAIRAWICQGALDN